MLPVTCLQYFVQKAVTVFFLPITEVLVSMVECEPDEETNVLILGLYPQIQCFSGMHLIHGGLSLLITAVFVLIALMCSYTLFENQMTTNNPKACRHSQGEVWFIICKTSLQLTFSFIPASMDWLLCLVPVTTGFGMWYVYMFDKPYYTESMNKFQQIMTCYFE